MKDKKLLVLVSVLLLPVLLLSSCMSDAWDGDDVIRITSPDSLFCEPATTEAPFDLPEKEISSSQPEISDLPNSALPDTVAGMTELELQSGYITTDIRTIVSETVYNGIVPSDDSHVYWTENGSVYHTAPDCSYLKKSKKLSEGSISQAEALGKNRLCSRCGKQKQNLGD